MLIKILSYKGLYAHVVKMPHKSYNGMVINTYFLQKVKQSGVFPTIIRDTSVSKILLKEYLKQKYVKRKIERFLEMSLCFQRKNCLHYKRPHYIVRLSLYVG